MPQDTTLAQMVRAKFPHSYDDLSDSDLETMVLSKHPEYSDLPRTSAQSVESQQAAALAPTTQAQSRAALLKPLTQPDFAERLQRAGNPGSFEGHPENVGEYVPQTVGQVASGVGNIAQGNVAKGGRQILSGATNAMLPAAPFAVAGAPLAAAVATASGAAGSNVAQKVAETAGATPDQAGLVGDLAGLLAGGVGAKYGTPLLSRGVGAAQDATSGLFFTPQNRFDVKRPLEMTARTLLGQPESSADEIMQNSVNNAVKRAILLRDAKGAAGIPTLGSPAQEQGFSPSVTRVPIRPEPTSPLTPESLAGPDSPARSNILSPLARQGDPRAAMELVRRGRKVLFTPDSGDYMSADDFQKLLSGLNE